MSHQAERGVNGNRACNGAVTEVDRRRSEPRTVCDREIALMPMTGDADRFATAHLTDCSPHGLGLVLSDPVKAGAQVLVRMNLNKMVLLVYTVRYCIPMQLSQFRAGAQFTGYAANSFQGEPASIVTALTGNE
jgi:hypothetical protein